MLETEEVQLGSLNFLKNRCPQPPDPSNNAQASPSQVYTATDPPPHSSSHSTPYGRLAAEKPDQQLASESAIWQMYVEEAKEHDSELVDCKNRNLDMMLLFATLFSAVLAAFIMDSRRMLQQDPADVSVKLLLAIAQSQQRIEQGTAQQLPRVEVPDFSPSMSARWINGLWYTALALSLAAALVAMLAKEWLMSFVASRPRPAYAHALVHQERLQGLSWWRALHIIDLLPTMLHVSLLLFSIGLMVYLWALDTAIAIIVAAITGVTVLFYIGTALLGATCRCCPFVTQMSKYFRAILGLTSRDVKCAKDADPDATEGTQDNDLYAMLWLAENARDPAIGDCACQALVGLHPPQPGSPELVSPSFSLPKLYETIRAFFFPIGPAPRILSRYDLLSELFDAVYTRLDQAQRRLSQEPAEHWGINMARYASAMPKLVYSFDKEERNNITRRQSSPAAESPAGLIFNVLDFTWSITCPALSPDTYAWFVSTELRMAEAMMRAHVLHQAHPLTQSGNTPQPNWLIHIRPSDHVSARRVSQFELQARYSRALSYAGFLLGYHNSGRAPISAGPLSYLLESILLAAQCTDLNPADHMSTCLPQSEKTSLLPAFCINIKPGMVHTVNPLALGDSHGLIVGLIELVSLAGTGNTPTEFTSGRTLLGVGPTLLKQWAMMMNKSPEHSLKQYRAGGQSVDLLLQHWPPLNGKTDHTDDLTQLTLAQLLIMVTIAVSLADCREASGLLNATVAALSRRANTVCGKPAMFKMVLKSGKVLSELLRYAHLNQNDLDSNTVESLLQLLLSEHSSQTLFQAQYVSLPPADVPPFLDVVLLILGSMKPGTNCIERLKPFVSDVSRILGPVDPQAWRTAENRPTLTAIYQLVEGKPGLCEEGLEGFWSGLKSWVANGA